MNKQKEYDWKDSNVALIGSKEHKTVTKESALTELAWKEALSCNKPSIFIWRIEKFKVVPWPKDSYGDFYEGDSYIVLNIYKDENELMYDIHFWIGKYSTQDEYGTAAYKTVELDTLLDDKPIQHREVQFYESEMFKSYFKDIVYLKGGCDSGFRHVETKEYKPRLFHVRGDKKNIVVNEVGFNRDNIASDDVFIIDSGSQIFQWNGSTCNHMEKFRAAEFANKLKGDRSGRAQLEILQESEMNNDHAMYKLLELHSDASGDDKNQSERSMRGKVQLMRISDDSGQIKMEEIASSNINRSLITEEDVFLLNTGDALFVYVGEKASIEERQNAIPYAHHYLSKSEAPCLPVNVISRNKKGPTVAKFEKFF